jgi:hypothetical protein
VTDNLTPDALVRREVHYCVSSLVSTLAQSMGAVQFTEERPRDLCDLCEQAFELACPIDDWEEAARQADYSIATGGPYFCDPNGEYVSDDEGTLDPTADDAWRLLCEAEGIEPYQREVYEHWIVSDWLAEKLAARGEKVDTDFAGMTVWARTTTGQMISMDSVIESICRDLPGEIEAALAAWSGRPDPSDPDNFWIDDATGERVNAATGKRTKAEG